MSIKIQNIKTYPDLYSIQWVNTIEDFTPTRVVTVPQHKIHTVAKSLHSYNDSAKWLQFQDNLELAVEKYLQEKYKIS